LQEKENKMKNITYVNLTLAFELSYILFQNKELNISYALTGSTKTITVPHVTRARRILHTAKPYLFIAPAVLLASVFCWIPAAKGFIESFITVNQAGSIVGFAGFSNYRILFSDKAFLNSLKVTAVFVLLFVPLNTFLTLFAASLTRRKSRLSFVPEYLFFSPVAVSLSAYSLLFREIFRGKASVINRILGISAPWLTDPAGAMITLAVLGVFLDFGIDYILLMCAFRSLDKDVLDAARVDGAGGRRLFFDIELPMVRETVLVTVFLALKDALLISAPIIILTEGGPFRSTETIMFYYYVEAFRSGNRAVQNALSSLVLTIAATAMTVFHLSRRRKKS